GANGSVTFADGWADGKRARFQRDASNPSAAGPDTEGITVDGSGWVYLASERDNSVKGVNENVVLKVDPTAPGPDVVATQEWDLTAKLPIVNANLGIEAVEWVADGDLTGLIDAGTNVAYDPARYPGHGDGLFFVAMEEGGGVFAFALNGDGTSKLVATIDPGLVGVMALDYDTVLDVLWAVCDDGCDGTAAQITFNGTAEPSIAHFARPVSMPNGNNEGFATAPSSVAGFARAAWWFKDGEPSGSLRTGTVPGGAVDPGTPVDPGAGNPSNPGLPQTGSGAPLTGEQLVEANNGDVTAPLSAEPGGRVTINTGTQNAGKAVSVWMYSTPVQIASGTLDSAGRIAVTIPTNATLGMHRLAVYAADGELLGWTSIRIVANGTLAQTGADEDSSALAIALLLMLAGLTAIIVRRRVRSA
ncbi:MAG: LPXTG cell wall anchor domain-containing protein, partial [Microbacterium sp.]|uniref:LPXTG cell wall anchor domain-containing protein n=1 Tax=Microbacterium sp. TaxID=51671 RepID=UPI0027194E4B